MIGWWKDLDSRGASICFGVMREVSQTSTNHFEQKEVFWGELNREILDGNITGLSCLCPAFCGSSQDLYVVRDTPIYKP